ncbi:3191_t:CDS:2 [Rhizophagus irregularis]|nr:3191_t:CDS:2 [Rhizophagus irregularis]
MNNFILFNILNVVKTSEFTISTTCLILETLLIDASSSQKYKEISSLESHIFSGFFGTILLVGVFISGNLIRDFIVLRVMDLKNPILELIG